jgi:hypothetical protein
MYKGDPGVVLWQTIQDVLVENKNGKYGIRAI